METHGRLHDFPIDLPGGVATPRLIEQVADLIINGNERLRADLKKAGSCDCSYALEGVARLRVNIYRQSSTYGIVMRKLQSSIPTLEDLKLPPIFREIIKENTGIVLVTGGTGSGKTSTLAAKQHAEVKPHDEQAGLSIFCQKLHPHARRLNRSGTDCK